MPPVVHAHYYKGAAAVAKICARGRERGCIVMLLLITSTPPRDVTRAVPYLLRRPQGRYVAPYSPTKMAARPCTTSHSGSAQHAPRALSGTVACPMRRGWSTSRRLCPVVRATKPTPGGSEPDLVERMVGFLFPKALSDPSPMGLKRINFDELPDQFVDMEGTAAPVAGDSGVVALIRPMLSRTQLEATPLRLAYDAEVDGWSPQAFHRGVDTFGAAVVVATTQGGAVIGGYNPEGWIGLGEDRMSNGAFLFSWPNGTAQGAKATKLPKVGGPNLAVIDKPDSGPQFGADGLSIPLKPKGQERTAKCKLGTYYERRPDGGRSLFAASEDPKKTTLTSLQVYVADGKGVEWKLEGITWKSSVGQ